MEELEIENKSGARWIWINRPQRGNSLTRELVPQLAGVFEDASVDPSVRAVTLSGVGDRFFCTGSDLGRTVADSSGRETQVLPEGDVVNGLRRGFQRLVVAMLDCDKPIIVGLNGLAAGAGAQVVLAADLVVAAEGAELAELFTRRGIVPDGGAAYLLSRLVGSQRSKRLCFFGDNLSASEALAWGLVSEVVPQADFRSTVEAWVDRLAQGPTTALAGCKRLINHAMDLPRDAAMWEEAHLMDVVRRTRDAKEGIVSFVERREPRFTGS